MVANLEQITELTKRLIGFRSNTAQNANRALDFARRLALGLPMPGADKLTAEELAQQKQAMKE